MLPKFDVEKELTMLTNLAASQLKEMPTEMVRHNALKKFIEASLLPVPEVKHHTTIDVTDKRVSDLEIEGVVPEFKTTNTYRAGDNILFVGEGYY